MRMRGKRMKGKSRDEDEGKRREVVDPLMPPRMNLIVPSICFQNPLNMIPEGLGKVGYKGFSCDPFGQHFA